MPEIELVNLDSAVIQLSLIPGKAEKAARLALRKTLDSAKKFAKKEVRKRYTIREVEEVTGTIMTQFSGGLSGKIVSRGPRISLEHFKATPRGRIEKRGKYIFASVVKGQGGILKRAFRPRRGGIIFGRNGKSRLPISKLYAHSAPQMLSHKRVADPLKKHIQNELQKNLLNSIADQL